MLLRTCATPPARAAPGECVRDKGGRALSDYDQRANGSLPTVRYDQRAVGRLAGPVQGGHGGKTFCTAEREATGRGIVLPDPQCVSLMSRLSLGALSRHTHTRLSRP